MISLLKLTLQFAKTLKTHKLQTALNSEHQMYMWQAKLYTQILDPHWLKVLWKIAGFCFPAGVFFLLPQYLNREGLIDNVRVEHVLSKGHKALLSRCIRFPQLQMLQTIKSFMCFGFLCSKVLGLRFLSVNIYINNQVELASYKMWLRNSC